MILNADNLNPLFNNGAINAKQAATFGLKYPLKHGWFKTLIGREISEAMYAELMDCKGRKPKGWLRKDWRKPCVPCEDPQMTKAEAIHEELDQRFHELTGWL